MKKIIIILAAFTTVLGLGSCKDSFLDITNTSKISTSVYPTSMYKALYFPISVGMQPISLFFFYNS